MGLSIRAKSVYLYSDGREKKLITEMSPVFVSLHGWILVLTTATLSGTHIDLSHRSVR